MNDFRLFFEPMDVKAYDSDEAIDNYNRKILKCGLIVNSNAPSIMRILPIGKDDIVVKSNR